MTFEQHKENLSRMFRQYQSQESAGSQSTIRTVSGVSQSFETMESVNGPAAQEMAPSTVIELTVDSSSSVTSVPLEGADEMSPASITVSNILASAEEEEQKSAQEPPEGVSGDGDGTEAAVTHEDSEELQSKETHPSNVQTSVSNMAATNGSNGLETVRDFASTLENDPKTAITDGEKPSKTESSNSMTEDSLNEMETEAPIGAEEEEDRTDQTASETAACLENSVVGGASVVNEDLVDVSSVSDQIHPSDADDSQEEPSDGSAAASRQEGDVEIKEDDNHREDESEKNRDGEDTDENQEIIPVGKNKQSEAEEQQASTSDSLTPPAETPEQTVTEPTKENVPDESPPSTISDTPAADQQPSDNTVPFSAQEVAAAGAAASASTPTSTKEETSADSSSVASSSGTQKGADSVNKTKEIKIARLDVSNVALDTERLELKETPATVCISFISHLFTCEVSYNYATQRRILSFSCNTSCYSPFCVTGVSAGS